MTENEVVTRSFLDDEGAYPYKWWDNSKESEEVHKRIPWNSTARVVKETGDENWDNEKKESLKVGTIVRVLCIMDNAAGVFAKVKAPSGEYFVRPDTLERVPVEGEFLGLGGNLAEEYCEGESPEIRRIVYDWWNGTCISSDEYKKTCTEKDNHEAHSIVFSLVSAGLG